MLFPRQCLYSATTDENTPLSNTGTTLEWAVLAVQQDKQSGGALLVKQFNLITSHQFLDLESLVKSSMHIVKYK